MEPQDIIAELSAKTLSTVASIISREEQGEISPSEARVALRAVFDVGSGLTDQETFNLISEADKALRKKGQPDNEKAYLLRNAAGVLVKVSRVWGSAKVSVKRLNPGDINWSSETAIDYHNGKRDNPFEAAHVAFGGMIHRLCQQGFEVLP